MNNPIAEISFENAGVAKFELYKNEAPQSVLNFISLANKGFYDGLIMHRVIKDFVAQGGDPEGTGMGGPGYRIKGEFKSNGFDNPILHEKGVISWARSGHPDSAGSQFYIALADINFLDGEYAAFGKIIDGEEVLNHFNEIKTGYGDVPLFEEKINYIKILSDEEFEEPDKL